MKTALALVALASLVACKDDLAKLKGLDPNSVASPAPSVSPSFSPLPLTSPEPGDKSDANN